jgi:hypothetical protein
MSAMSSRAMAWVTGTSRSIALGENAGSSRRRAGPWAGGSSVTGGPMNSEPSPGLGPVTLTVTEEKWSLSWAMEEMSVYRVGSHCPPQRAVWVTGSAVRRAA